MIARPFRAGLSPVIESLLVNVAAEYHDPGSEVRRAVEAHRGWFHRTLIGLFTKTGHPEPSGLSHPAV